MPPQLTSQTATPSHYSLIPTSAHSTPTMPGRAPVQWPTACAAWAAWRPTRGQCSLLLPRRFYAAIPPRIDASTQSPRHSYSHLHVPSLEGLTTMPRCIPATATAAAVIGSPDCLYRRRLCALHVLAAAPSLEASKGRGLHILATSPPLKAAQRRGLGSTAMGEDRAPRLPRSHKCGELRATDEGQTVHLRGWLQHTRYPRLWG